MKKEYIGDSKDFVKRVILNVLSRTCCAKIIVDPLITDFSNWDDVTKEEYAGILGLNRRCFIVKFEEYSGKKDHYTKHQEHSYDVFFDPNKGIGNNVSKDHISYGIIKELCKDRVVIIYNGALDRRDDLAHYETIWKQQFNNYCYLLIEYNVVIMFVSDIGKRVKKCARAIKQKTHVLSRTYEHYCT